MGKWIVGRINIFAITLLISVSCLGAFWVKTALASDRKNSLYAPQQDLVVSQFYSCWNPPAGARNALELAVVIHAEFNTDGNLIKAEIADEDRSRYNSDTYFSAAVDAVLRAVSECSPLKNLPPENYDSWHYAELRFDPREMLQ